MMGTSLVRIADNPGNIPVLYQSAVRALQECEAVDEVAQFEHQAAALVEYGRQANDDTLIVLAGRLRKRASYRLGELLATYDGRGRPRSGKRWGGPTISRRAIAKAAGVTQHQQSVATALAAIPAPVFESLVEQTPPPTMSQLARLRMVPMTGLEVVGPDIPGDLPSRIADRYVKDLQRFLADVRRAGALADELTEVAELVQAKHEQIRQALAALDTRLAEIDQCG